MKVNQILYLNESKLSLEIMLGSLVALKYSYLRPKLFKTGPFLKIEVSIHWPYQFFEQEWTVMFLGLFSLGQDLRVLF